MKILKRNYTHRNLIVFLFLSLVYLHAIHSISYGQGFFSLPGLRTFLLENYLIIFMTFLTTYLIVKIKRFSELFLLVCLVAIVGKNFVLLSTGFNKLTLVLDFIYLVFAFYFFITWEVEVQLAAFNPLFSKFDLEKYRRFKLMANISSDAEGEDTITAAITNIDQESCFLLLPQKHALNLSPTRLYFLEANYEGIRFKQTATLISSYDHGIGLIFDKSKDARVSWSELYKVCLERGLVS